MREQEVFTPTDEVTREKLEPDLSNGETPPEDLEKNAEAPKKAYDESLVFALEKTFRYHFWLGGILQLLGGMHIALRFDPCQPRELRNGLQMLYRRPHHWSPKPFSHSWSTRITAHDSHNSSQTIPRLVVGLVWRSACLPCKARATHCHIVIILM
jgi:hypothetical protein